MEFLPEDIDRYAAELTAPESEHLAALNRETYLKTLMPRMLSGHMQGRILSMFSHMIKPKTVLEIGTFTGYSALCFAEGLQPDGKVITIDVNPELEAMVRKYISLSGMEDKIDFKIGDATQIIAELSGPFDLVFIDADKENYSLYFDLVIDKLAPNGWIIADNVLWSGKVTAPFDSLDDETKALVNYSTKVANDPRVEQVLLPVRDGLMICRKK